MLEKQSLDILRQALEKLDGEFSALPANSANPPEMSRVAEVLEFVTERLADNYPYFHPLYAGQMLKPPHPVARLAYALAQWINPNNHALDGGRASSMMEKDAVAELAAMFEWDEHLGHLTSGGTMANLEALWIAGRLAPGKKILGSEHAHYTHRRISSVLQLEFEEVPCDLKGRMDLAVLEKRLSGRDVGTVVATLGTTAMGSVDPLADITALRQRYGFRVHCDAAYGGYFCLASNLAKETHRSFDAISKVDSIVIDPHKHGLQPYGCGCVLFHDPGVGRFYKHDSPYTYFSSKELHLGEISLECSRPGASAVALWATQKLLPLVKGGEFARGLESCHETALEFRRRIAADRRFFTASVPELDIVVFAPRAGSISESSYLTRRVFEAAAKRNLHLAVADLPAELFGSSLNGTKKDGARIACLRSVLMKPEHRDWLDRIWTILSEATDEALRT